MRFPLAGLPPTIGLLLASCASTGQPFGVSLVSGPTDGIALTAPLDKASTVTLETGGGDAGVTVTDPFFGTISFDADVDYRRLEYRTWINPNERLEYFYGVSWNYYALSDFNFDRSAHALGLSIGAAYWLSKAFSFELSYMQDVVDLHADDAEFDMDGLRFGLSYWF